MKTKRKNCYVCSDEYWPKRCAGAERNCYTVEQCCREIIDISFSLEEWLFLRRVVDYAMLPRELEK